MKPDKNKTPEDLPEDQKKLGLRVFDLVLDRVLRRVYLEFNEAEKSEMEKAFSSDSDKEREKFIKKYVPNFKELFEEEAKKIEAELKVEIEKQV